MYCPARRHDWLRAAALALVAGVIWLWLQQGWRAEAWQAPAAVRTAESYIGDELELLARVKAAQEHGWNFATASEVSRLGAPWQADWAAYSMPDMAFTLATAQLANVVGLIPAANAMLLLAHVLAVLAFYFCSRVLGHRPIFAAVAALLFGFSYYNCNRSLVHFSFTLSFIVPLILLTAFLASSSRVLWQRRAWWLTCTGITFWTGLANPYFGYLFLQLLAFAVLYRWLSQSRERFLLWRGLALFGVFFAALLFGNWHAVTALGQGSTLLQRNYAGTELYGLRVIDLLIPPGSHRWGAAAALGNGYFNLTTFKGEAFSPYLGLVGIAGLLLVVALALRQMLQRRFGLRPSHLPLIAWVLVYSATGGLNSLFALAVTPLFRGANRYSVVILALVLLALASWATRAARRLPRAWSIGIALLVALVGIWDQCPSRRVDQEAEVRAKIETDRQLGATLEAALPAGALVFQLPAVPFLEQPAVHQMMDYELFRPYFFTNTIRFSYGLLGGRLYRWQQNVGRLPATELRAVLEKAGFAAVYLHRKAFPDGGEALCRDWEAAGLTRLFAAGDHVVYRLQPAAIPVLPLPDDPRMFSAWDDKALIRADQPAALFGSGWFRLEQAAPHAWRWAGDRAVMLLHNPSAAPITVELEGSLTALGSAEVSLTLGRQKVWEGHVSSRTQTPFKLRLQVPAGSARLTWTSSEAARAPSLSDPRKLGFLLQDFRANFP